jgi:hypothetical protein
VIINKDYPVGSKKRENNAKILKRCLNRFSEESVKITQNESGMLLSSSATEMLGFVNALPDIC